MQDGRHIVRDKVIYGGVAETGQHGATVHCVVRNRGTRLPEQVDLARARSGRSYFAEVVWRQANMVGLALRTMFTEPPENDLDVRLRRSQKKKRELQRRIKQLLEG